MPPDPAPFTAARPGLVIGDRYRLEQCLSEGVHGLLWRGADQLAADAPVALRQLTAAVDQQRARELWGRLQGVLHPQVPRLGAALSQGGHLWLVREWQAGRTYRELLADRSERQLVFGAGEVLLLLRQLLPVLAVLHGQGLVHGDLCPANLLRRDHDGLPVLLDYGLVAEQAAVTPGYGPPELARGGLPEAWMDLHALGVTALVLLSGDPPESLLDPGSLAWRWPACLDQVPDLQQALARLLQRDPGRRFGTAAEALAAFQALPMPETTGPVPRADRTVALLPPTAVPAAPPAAAPVPPQPPEPAPAAAVVLPQAPPPAARLRAEEREQSVEGGLWPVVIALVLSALVGTVLGWWWLSRGQQRAATAPDATMQLPSSLPAVEVDQRQQLLNRLRAMQVDRGWFLKLVDASLLARFPERRGRLPGDSLADAPLRKVWNELAEEWLARVEQLPLDIRRRLGSFSNGDWEQRQKTLKAQGLSGPVLRQLVSAQARNLLPGSASSAIPVEPFRQLWYAAAEQSLATMQIEPIQARPSQPQVLTAPVNAGGARLFPIRLPEGYRLVLGVNGSPLMQMSVFAADGTLLEPSGPLRVLSLPPQARSPVQLLVANEGVAPALITLSLRADPPPPELPPGPPVSPGVVPETPGRSPAAEPPSPDQSAPAPPDRPSARAAEPAADSQPPAAAQ